MNTKSNNAPYAVVELTKDQYDFLIRNCETNMLQGLNAVDPCGPMADKLSRSTITKLVDLIEEFRSLKQAAQRGVL
jgi:hypothetical protein